MPFVAENLGVITPKVEAIRREFGFPGMSLWASFNRSVQGCKNSLPSVFGRKAPIRRDPQRWPRSARQDGFGLSCCSRAGCKPNFSIR
ncbi:MAG: hypothetical protein WCC59_12105 [Terriglobales bacterium]